MNERFMNLDDLDKYGQNLITYSDYVNDSMNKIAAGFNNLYSAKIIQGRRAQVFINVYYEMEESRKNVVDKLYEVKEFVDTVNKAMQNLDSEQAKKLQASLEEMGIKRGKGGNSGGGSTSGGSEGEGTAPTRTTTEEDEQRVQNELGKTSTEGTTGKGEDTTQNNSSESEPNPTSNQDVGEENLGDNTSPSTSGSNDQTVPGEDLGQGENPTFKRIDDSRISEKDKYYMSMNNANEDYIPQEDMIYAYEKYSSRRLAGSRKMSYEEFAIKHSNFSPEEKNYRMQEFINRDLRKTTGREMEGISKYYYPGAASGGISTSNYPKPQQQTVEDYINRIGQDRNYNPDAPLFGRWSSKGSNVTIKDLYKNVDGHGGMYMPWTNNNIGLTVKETVKVDGQEYTLSVDTDKIPTTGEWNQAKMDFIRKIAKPDSIIESSKTTYSFFNLDLEKAKQAYEKTL